MHFLCCCSHPDPSIVMYWQGILCQLRHDLLTQFHTAVPWEQLIRNTISLYVEWFRLMTAAIWLLVCRHLPRYKLFIIIIIIIEIKYVFQLLGICLELVAHALTYCWFLFTAISIKSARFLMVYTLLFLYSDEVNFTCLKRRVLVVG